MATQLNQLTDRKLRALHGASSEKGYKLSDGGGLMIRVTAKGAISWVFKYRLRLGGREEEAKIFKIGVYPDLTLAKAREMRTQFRQWLAEGKDPQRMMKLERQATLKPVTVKDAIEYWITNYADENRIDAERDRGRFRKHIYPRIGDIAVSDCTTQHWLECFSRIKKTSPTAAGAILQAAKQAFKYCKNRNYAVCRVLDDLTKNDISVKAVKRERYLSTEELTDVLKAIDSHAFSPYYESMIYLLLVFGARTVEIRQSGIGEWDLKKMVWTVPKENVKGRRREIVRPIPERVKPLIERLIEQNKKTGLLLGELKKPANASQGGRKLYKQLNHSRPWALHDLRRTFSTCLGDLGILPHIVEQLLGHAIRGAEGNYNLARYLPYKLDALNQWLDSLEILAGKRTNVVNLPVANRS
ncbi:TPA: tyrosine-type recombinase/integrase [Salmonella enterica subsp. enterica serovar Muenchen]